VSVPVSVSVSVGNRESLSFRVDTDKEITYLFYGMNIRSYRDLIAWQKGIDLCGLVYRASSAFPSHELYGLRSQVRRAAVSVPSNIAEGAGRITRGEFIQSIGYARGSLLEVETQVIVAERFGYLSSKEADKLLEMTNEIGRVTNGLIRSLTQTRSS
jgi:four helix bundle protein